MSTNTLKQGWGQTPYSLYPLAFGALPPETLVTHVVRGMPLPFHSRNTEGVVLAKVCNLSLKNRLAVNLLDPQTTLLTLDLQVVVSGARGDKAVTPRVTRPID